MMALQEDTSIGQYRIERLLPEGQGGFARVAAARRMVGQELHERVAIKVAHTAPKPTMPAMRASWFRPTQTP